MGSQKQYLIKEVFGPTIQGEGSKAGTLVHFVRFSGCNMWNGKPESKAASECPFCDTDFFGGTKMTLDEIETKLKELGHVRDIVCSGGEPLLQMDQEFVDRFKDQYNIHIETNGSKEAKFMMADVHHITMSPKEDIDRIKLMWAHDIKILYPYQKPEISIEQFYFWPAQNKFLQPVMDDNYQVNLNKTIDQLKRSPGWRLSLQTHKMIGVP